MRCILPIFSKIKVCCIYLSFIYLYKNSASNIIQHKIRYLFLTIFNSSPNIISWRGFFHKFTSFSFPEQYVFITLFTPFLNFQKSSSLSIEKCVLQITFPLLNFVYHKFINQNEVVYNVFNFLFWPTKPPKTEGLTDERNGPWELAKKKKKINTEQFERRWRRTNVKQISYFHRPYTGNLFHSIELCKVDAP